MTDQLEEMDKCRSHAELVELRKLDREKIAALGKPQDAPTPPGMEEKNE